MTAQAAEKIAPGEVLLDVENISLSFGGVKAIQDISFNIEKAKSARLSAPMAPVKHPC